jgi:hypothetical protein
VRAGTQSGEEKIHVRIEARTEVRREVGAESRRADVIKFEMRINTSETAKVRATVRADKRIA